MSTHKHIDLICIAATLCAILLMILFINGEAMGITVMSDIEDTDLFTENDLLSDWDTSDATIITLNGTTGTVSGTGAYIADGDVHIAFAGKYILSGELTDGSVIVDADGDDKLWILLDGVSLHCEDNAALLIQQAKKVFLTLAPGKINTISGGTALSTASSQTKTDGIIFSRDDLTINGRGTLSVRSDYRHGIVCNDSLTITDGTIQISAPQDGIHAHDSVKIANAALQITAGDDGITVENDDQTDLLYIASGSVSINGCYEGLEASSVLIAGGTIDIVPSDDGINAEKSIEIAGGDIRIVNENGRDADGLDSNGDIVISGGKLLISVNTAGGNCAIDYGSEQGGICRIDGGTVIACGSTFMAEEISSASKQDFIMHQASGDADSLLSLQDADGREIISATIPCAFALLTVSDPSLIKGDTYSLFINDTLEEIIVDNTSEVSGFGGWGGFDGKFEGRPDGKSDKPDGFEKDFGKFDGQRPDKDIPMPNGNAPKPDAVPAMGQPPQPNAAFDQNFPVPPDNMPFDQGERPVRDPREQKFPAAFERNENINRTTFILIGISAALLCAALYIAAKFHQKINAY